MPSFAPGKELRMDHPGYVAEASGWNLLRMFEISAAQSSTHGDGRSTSAASAAPTPPLSAPGWRWQPCSA